MNEEKLGKIESKINCIYTDVAVIKNNIRWIVTISGFVSAIISSLISWKFR